MTFHGFVEPKQHQRVQEDSHGKEGHPVQHRQQSLLPLPLSLGNQKECINFTKSILHTQESYIYIHQHHRTSSSSTGRGKHTQHRKTKTKKKLPCVPSTCTDPVLCTPGESTTAPGSPHDAAQSLLAGLALLSAPPATTRDPAQHRA